MSGLGHKIMRSIGAAARKRTCQFNVDAMRSGRIDGWIKLSDSDRPVCVRIEINRQVVADGLICDLYREDLAQAGIASGRFGFSVVLPDGILDDTPCKVIVFNHENGQILSSQTVQPDQFLYNFDNLTVNSLYGWCFRVNDMTPLTVNILVDNKVIASNLRADISRKDVSKLFGCNHLCGFEIDISQENITASQKIILQDSQTCAELGRRQVAEFTTVPPEKSVARNNKAPDVSKMFDASYYLINNPDVAAANISPLRHFMEYGWREYRNPSAGFDLIWYTQNYLDSNWKINPVLHYVTHGYKQNYQTKPRSQITFSTPVDYKNRQTPIRRVCLFAGYDKDGIIDPVATELIAEIAKFADVYYLADCQISSTELDKLASITKGAWAGRHGKYDFGSWSRLANELVGWTTLKNYDELILANDSFYLMHGLKHVFETMDARPCDWWGLQATKGMVSTFSFQGLGKSIQIDETKKHWLSRFEQDLQYDFHVGSYFLVFRNAVMNNDKFQGFLNGILQEKKKIDIIKKYEVGLTRLLISCGHEFDTFVSRVFPGQPVYTEKCFELIEDGFPILKKYHLVENHYKVSQLHNWPQRLKQAGVTKDLTPYVENLHRIADNKKLYRSMDVESFELNPPKPNEVLVEEDLITPKYNNWWCFPVCGHSHLFNDNIRALFEHVKNDKSIKKIVLTRSKGVKVSGHNVVVVPLASSEGQFYLLRAKHIFLKHGVSVNLAGLNLSGDLHDFHNLWHGIPLKRIGYASRDQKENLAGIEKQNRLLRSVICGSKVDQLAMCSAYWPLTIDDIWLTGLPRHDFITMAEQSLPSDMMQHLSDLRKSLRGRKLILFTPTFKNDQADGYYRFSDDEYKALTDFLVTENMVLGIREHMADKHHQYSSQLAGDCYISLSETIYPNIEVPMREAHALITDYSSIFVDFLITGRPVISFAYDYDNYVNHERGLFYDLDWSFPGKITKNFSELLTALRDSLLGMNVAEKNQYEQRRKIFIDTIDNNNSARVAQRVTELQRNDLTVFDINKIEDIGKQQHRILWVYDRINLSTARYRIFNLVPELEKTGWINQVITSELMTVADAQRASIVVFCRVKATDEIMDIAEAIKRTGGRVIFDIDDLMFMPENLMQAEYYRDRLDQKSTIRNECMRLRRLLLEADLVTVTTPALKRQVESTGRTAIVVPNSIGSGLINFYASKPDRPKALLGKPIRVCYLSGTTTHADDFRLVMGAAAQLRAEQANIEFNIVGNVAFDSPLNDELLSGWNRHARMSYEQMHDFLSQMDINLAPLTPNVFNDCKSQLKIFEAGLHGIPTIASPTHSYRTGIEHDRSGLLAEGQEDWYRFIKLLSTNSKLRHSLGREAHRTAISSFSAEVVAKSYIEDILNR